MWPCFYKLSTRAWGCVCDSSIKGLEAGVDEKFRLFGKRSYERAILSVRTADSYS